MSKHNFLNSERPFSENIRISVTTISGSDFFFNCEFQILLITPAQTVVLHSLEYRRAQEDMRHSIFILLSFPCQNVIELKYTCVYVAYLIHVTFAQI